MGTRMNIVLGLLILFVQQVASIEFYYNLQKNVDQCFEEHLGAQLLMTGEIFFEGSGSIKLFVENPKSDVILTQVSNNEVLA